jgi:hypothetical protein
VIAARGAYHVHDSRRKASPKKSPKRVDSGLRRRGEGKPRGRRTKRPSPRVIGYLCCRVVESLRQSHVLQPTENWRLAGCPPSLAASGCADSVGCAQITSWGLGCERRVRYRHALGPLAHTVLCGGSWRWVRWRPH